MRLALSLLALAVVTALVDRMVGRRAPRPVGRAAPRAVVRVCLSLPVGVDWRDVVLQYIQRATDPRRLRFSVLLECSEARQALLGDADDLFRGRAVVQHVRAPRDPDDHVGRVRRLVRRCVAGDETLVVLADRRVRAAPGWDETLLALVGQEAVVLSAPVSAHPVAFPCLAPVDGGAAAVRAASRPFADASRTVAVPSVCRCLEFVAAAPDALARGAPDAVPACAVVEPDAALEGDLLRSAPRLDRRAGHHERVGLTRPPVAEECILKYGSTRVARLALRLE